MLYQLGKRDANLKIQKHKTTNRQTGKNTNIILVKTQNTDMYKNLSMQTSKQKKTLKGKPYCVISYQLGQKYKQKYTEKI